MMLAFSLMSLQHSWTDISPLKRIVLVSPVAWMKILRLRTASFPAMVLEESSVAVCLFSVTIRGDSELKRKCNTTRPFLDDPEGCHQKYWPCRVPGWYTAFFSLLFDGNTQLDVKLFLTGYTLRRKHLRIWHSMMYLSLLFFMLSSINADDDLIFRNASQDYGGSGPPPHCLQSVSIQVGSRCRASPKCGAGQCAANVTFFAKCGKPDPFLLKQTDDCNTWRPVLLVRCHNFYLISYTLDQQYVCSWLGRDILHLFWPRTLCYSIRISLYFILQI